MIVEKIVIIIVIIVISKLYNFFYFIIMYKYLIIILLLLISCYLYKSIEGFMESDLLFTAHPVRLICWKFFKYLPNFNRRPIF